MFYQLTIKLIKTMDLFKIERKEIYTVKFSWELSQPFVCGTFEEIIKYAIENQKNGIDGFYHINNFKFEKMTKKELTNRLSYTDKVLNLKEQLFKIY